MRRRPVYANQARTVRATAELPYCTTWNTGWPPTLPFRAGTRSVPHRSWCVKASHTTWVPEPITADRANQAPSARAGRPGRMGRAPQEGVHASPRRPGQQRDERFAQHQPQCHQGARDEDVHGEHSPHGMCHLAEFHGSGDGRVRVVRQVGRERSGDERGGDEGSTAPSGPADPREHGCGVAERERHDGKYA